MAGIDHELSSHVENTLSFDSEQQRIATLTKLGFLDPESVPVFDEATQIAAHLLNAPICILGVIDRDRQWLKSAVGLSRIGLMNDLATSRQIPRQESFCRYVIERQRLLVVEDATTHPDLQTSVLAQRYGIRAYLGVPLLTSDGHCVGTLAIMELNPRIFTSTEIGFLELIARWSMSEFERNYLLKHQGQPRLPAPLPSHSHGTELLTPLDESLPTATVRANLIGQMAHELRTPLTSILGMTSVLSREIYGPLTGKQREYLDIVHDSGKYMLSLVNELAELGALDDGLVDLDLHQVNVEMLCQQVITALEDVSHRREQEIRLTIEPGRRVWLLDKTKVRQMVYHLLFHIIQLSSTGTSIRIHVSRKQCRLHIAVWTSHPMLGEGFEVYTNPVQVSRLLNGSVPFGGSDQGFGLTATDSGLPALADPAVGEPSPHIAPAPGNRVDVSRQHLGLVLSQRLLEMHGGILSIQGTPELGYRYVLMLPEVDDPDSAMKNCPD
ncbi:MAG: GAF domain-containing sensor histidine kinase [Synechococcales bacterium]|nr:GAF domain-containing sensor histidine kinase [Synechococcales bacterium]